MKLAALNQAITDAGAIAIVVMGVSGAGKTTVGTRLAKLLNASFIDGDDLFSDEARAMMAGGTPLDDEWRREWLDHVGGAIASASSQGRRTVVACSALRRVYRDRLRGIVGSSLRFVYLRAEREAVRERVACRPGHYMPPSLVESQFATLEPPSGEDDVIAIAADSDLSTALPALAVRLTPTPSIGESDVPSVAVVGAGVMGSAIATRLLQTNCRVAVFDIDAEKVKALVAEGARGATDPADAARGTPFVITSLNSAAIVEAALFGAKGIATAADPDTVLIDMSSIDPESTRSFAARLAQACGAAWLDCPLSGGAPGAAAGRLTVMAGGSSEDFERARSVMERLTANYTLMGPLGAGQATKLINQVLCAIAFQAVAEAIALAERAGVAADRIPAALAGGRADSRILQEFGAKMARRDYTPTGRLDNMVKDLTGVLALARATDTAMPVTDLVTEIHQRFVTAGQGGDDNAALMRQFD